jgi:hypothetical protein
LLPGPCRRASSAPVDAHRVLVVTVVNFELAVVGTFQRFTDPLGQVDIGGRGVHAIGAFVEVHDPIHRVLLALVFRLVTDELDKLGPVRSDERAFQRHLACGKLVADALTGRT